MSGAQTRRSFLRSTLAGGVWTLGLSMLPGEAATAPAAAPGTSIAGGAADDKAVAVAFDCWLSFAADGTLDAYTTVTNLGQGTHTAIVQLVMEELELAAAQIRIHHAPVRQEFHRRFPKGITTFASAGLRTARDSVGLACAAARDMLLRAAAQRWQVEPSSCHAADGHIAHGASGRRLAYSALLAQAAALPPPEKPKLKAARDCKVLGQPMARADIPERVDGSAVYGIDVKLPGLLVAAVLHAPGFGGALLRVDTAPALKVRGVRQVVRLANAVAVVADGYWQAEKAARLLKPVWRAGPHGKADSAAMRAEYRAAVMGGDGLMYPRASDRPDKQDHAATAAALQGASRIIETVYEVPFLAHAAMEPLNATVSVGSGPGGGAELWLSTQSQTDTQRAVAKALGLTVEQVTLHTQQVGGGFGRRLEHDFAVEAALIAKAVGKPVKTIWSREHDMRSGYYRPATTARVRLALDAQHRPTALRGDMAGPSLLAYSGVTNSPPIDGVFDWSYLMGWMGRSYAIPAYDTRWSRVDHGVPCGYWRSVGNSQNCYFIEHTLDQAARAAGVDPVAYRRGLLVGKTRQLSFIDQLCARAGWDAPPAPGHFRGFALNETGPTLGGHVVEIAVAAPGQFRLVRITAAIDPGRVANPSLVEAQMMGGTLFGLSAALFGEITLKDGAVEQGNYDGYQVARMAHTPPLEVLVIGSGEVGYGVGEEGPPSIVAALANALLAAGGEPVTRMPVAHSGWEWLA